MHAYGVYCMYILALHRRGRQCLFQVQYSDVAKKSFRHKTNVIGLIMTSSLISAIRRSEIVTSHNSNYPVPNNNHILQSK